MSTGFGTGEDCVSRSSRRGSWPTKGKHKSNTVNNPVVETRADLCTRDKITRDAAEGRERQGRRFTPIRLLSRTISLS